MPAIDESLSRRDVLITIRPRKRLLHDRLHVLVIAVLTRRGHTRCLRRNNLLVVRRRRFQRRELRLQLLHLSLVASILIGHMIAVRRRDTDTTQEDRASCDQRTKSCDHRLLLVL